MGTMRAAAVLGIETNYIRRELPCGPPLFHLFTRYRRRAPGSSERGAACALESAGRDVSGCKKIPSFLKSRYIYSRSKMS